MVSNDEDYSSFGRYSSLASLPPSSRLCTSAVLEHEEDQHAHYGFIAVLGLAQRLNVDILPLSWDIKQRPIGRGGQATIYHTMIDRESGFVFKCFDHIDQQQDLFRQVVQEMAVLGHPAVRAHPHINNLEGLCWNVIDENQIWPALVFEKSHLGDLDSFVKTQRAIELSIEDRLELCVQIGIAIRDMHANGIVHGDIKPGNILVFEADTGRITVKMTDFGWSTWFRAERKAILMPRSLPWNAPEHMWQTVEMKEAKLMDVYSYGLLCLWLLLCVDSASASRSFRALDWMQYLGFTTERSLLHAWKQDQDDPLLKWAIWALSEHGTFDIDMEQDLVKFFKSCLTFDPYMRNMNWQHLLELLAPNRDIADPIILSGYTAEAEDFKILTSLPSLYRADFRLRRKITLSLETIVENTEGPHFEHASTTNAVEQLAICYRVGLGLTKQENAAHGFQQHDVGDRLRSTSTSQTLNQTGCNHGRQRHGFHGHGVKSHNYRRDAELLQMAISVLNNEVAQMEGIFETHHPIVLAHNQRLSQVLLDGGYLKEAAKVAEQVYKVSKRNYAENHPQLSLATQILARTYTAQRRWEEARGLVMRLLQRSPISDRNRFNCLFDLAMIHVGQSNWEHVESLGDQMYEIAKSGLGPSHVHTLACMHLLKDAYERQGKEGNKNNMEERLLKEKIKFYDKSSEEARSNTTRLHELYVAVGNSAALSRAETLLLQLLQESILAVGLEHPDTLDRRDGLADVYHRMYKYAQAREQLTEALAVRKRTLGERHIDTVNSMANLFQVYKSEESWKKCEELGSEVLKIREEILGAEHPDTWTAMSDLSRAFLGLNLFTAAEELDKRLLDLKITKLGELHQDTQVAAMNLAATYRTHAKHEETKAIYDQLNGAAYDIDHRMAVVRRKHMMSQVEQASGPTNLQTFLRDMKSPRAWRKKMGEIWKDSWSGFHDIDDPERNG